MPPGPLVAELASTLGASSDELLGARPIKNAIETKAARLPRRLQKVGELPPADQRAILKMVDALNYARRRNGQR